MQVLLDEFERSRLAKYSVVTVHASATPPSRGGDRAMLDRMHKNRGWSGIGYHLVIQRDGTVEIGRPWRKMGAHVGSHNKHNFGICLIGGVDEDMDADDNFTDAQKKVLLEVLVEVTSLYTIGIHNIMGHRDWSPDKDGNGKITPNEFIKQCPCFDVKSWFQSAFRQYALGASLDGLKMKPLS